MDDVKPRRTWTQRSDSARAEAAEATRKALIAAGRALFAEFGYHGVGVRDITARAGVTRGAMSHHFESKEALFLAVFDEIEHELMAIPAGAGAAPDPSAAWSEFRKGVQRYLDAALRADVQRVTLIDGPVVLGWRRWRALEEGYSLGGLMVVLEMAVAQGLIRDRPLAPLAHLLLGSIMEAALLIAHADAPDKTRAEVGAALEDLLAGLQQPA